MDYTTYRNYTDEELISIVNHAHYDNVLMRELAKRIEQPDTDEIDSMLNESFQSGVRVVQDDFDDEIYELITKYPSTKDGKIFVEINKMIRDVNDDNIDDLDINDLLFVIWYYKEGLERLSSLTAKSYGHPDY